MKGSQADVGARVLIVDDESQIRQFLRISLKADGYQVQEAANGRDALAQAGEWEPDIIILDLGLPDLDGVVVLKKLRTITAVPVIVLSVRDHEQQKVEALNLGANDYVTKPFGVDELLARMSVHLRQVAQRAGSRAVGGAVTYGELTIDLAGHQVVKDGHLIRLTPKEFAILERLVASPGQLVTQARLLEEIWGPTHTEHTHYLRIVIGRLRQKLGDDPTEQKYIETEPGIGYRFCEPDF
ncbi:response regulator [Marinobacter lacisalsi]|uniref:Response regulator n=1 Tax=Marinobacter lacisalsi TaxID=475979 RepID=A0ABV8QIA5_9GAMM